MAKIRIVNFISGGDLGGPKQSFLHYTEVLEGLDYEVYSLIRAGAPLKPLLEKITRNVKEVSYLRSFAPVIRNVAARRLRKKIWPLAPNIVIAHKQIDIALLRLAMNNSCKIVGVIHGYNSKHIQHADALVAVSISIKDFLVAEGYKKKIYVIPNMVKIAGDVPEIKTISEIPRIGVMGMFRRKKGMDVFINALSILNDKGVKFSAVIAGKGYLSSRLRKLKDSDGLNNVLEIRPWLTNDEKWDFLDSLDIFCLPSRSESFGMVVIEAMARKKIVVATKCGGPEEVIEHGTNGFLVENDSPVEMANCIQDIIENQSEYSHIAVNAYKSVKSIYSLEAVRDSVRAVIDDLS